MEFKFEWIDLFLVAPAIALFLASIIPLTIKVLNGNREQNTFATVVYGLMGIVAASGFVVANQGAYKLAFQGALIFDGVSTWSSLIVLFITALTLLFSRENFSTNTRQFSEYVFLVLNAAIGMLMVVWSNDLIVTFVGIEVMSLSLYMLIALSSEFKLSKEAAFKYFVLGSFASAIFLYSAGPAVLGSMPRYFSTMGPMSVGLSRTERPQLPSFLAFSGSRKVARLSRSALGRSCLILSML